MSKWRKEKGERKHFVGFHLVVCLLRDFHRKQSGSAFLVFEKLPNIFLMFIRVVFSVYKIKHESTNHLQNKNKKIKTGERGGDAQRALRD